MIKNAATIYIIRHGETDWNIARRVQGLSDIPLNKNGELQAKDCAERLKHIHFDLAFSSDLLRAKRTAEIILLERKLAVQTTQALRERAFGKLEGKSGEHARAFFDEVTKLKHEERLKAKYDEDSESDEDILNRLIPFLREAAIINPGKTILMTSHGGTMRALLIHLGLYTYEEMENSAIENTAYIHLETDGVEFDVKEVSGVVDWKEFEKKH